MKSGKVYFVGMFLLISTIAAGPELALAGKGGQGKGGSQEAGANVTRGKDASQHQYKPQNRYQYRQETGVPAADHSSIRGDQPQARDRIQLRDPATHDSDTSE